MRRELVAKLALGCAVICMGGSLLGLELANYATSGSFDFYRDASLRQWTARSDDLRPSDFPIEAAVVPPLDGALLQRAAFGP
ncbi:MAG: hypothetical protein J7500_12095 [Sphingomonas sp.]|uniref:hypothetical protein n=1 Tax=Sphingomonas sp. TaxID=28214 RepID=UPI001B088E0B|nr:hypothetical protein [Sphingomonas sp.]MBO9623442.1 hypothetical protein [Sphingomonas sp.]